MSALDWCVVAAYLLGMFILAVFVGRRQSSTKDYFLGGQQMSSGSLAASTIATQCSTNSLLGAPAFVGFTAGGGLVWLQYELAVPLAMAALILLLVPARTAGITSIYAILESNLGVESRRLASGCFLLFRGIATGVTIYGVSVVLSLLLNVSYTMAVLLITAITILYDLIGGLRAVVLSDVIQLALLTGSVVVSLFLLSDYLPWFGGIEQAAVIARREVLVNDWGLTGNDYGFWPMLIGGFFLYCAYYGCDQSQAQRVLAAKSPQATARVLLYNGVFRFPLVFAYCLLGLGLAAYAVDNPSFLDQLPRTDLGAPNYNMAFPTYVLQAFTPGLVGLVMVGLIAAAMSSIDSAINSLSAATIEDFVLPRVTLTAKQSLLCSRFATAAWGLLCLVFSYSVESIAPTVLEAINKIGSLANGPLLALFGIALFTRNFPQFAVLTSFVAALVANLLLAYFAPDVSWLWWNLHGFAWTIGLSAVICIVIRAKFSWRPSLPSPQGNSSILLLCTMALLILTICFLVQPSPV